MLRWLVPIFLTSLVAFAVEIHRDNAVFHGSLTPATTGQSLGDSSHKWSAFLSALSLPGSTSQYTRGDGSAATLDTSVVPENGNLYFTSARVLAVGNFITALTGDGTTSGFSSGSATLTLSSVVSPGSCTNCTVTFDAKGRATAFSTGSAGSSVCTPLTKSGNYTIVSGDVTSCQILDVKMNCSAACTLTLIATAGGGRIVNVKNTGSYPADVSGAMDGDTVYHFQRQYEAASFHDDGGSEWSIY